jgi:hypothetical protein
MFVARSASFGLSRLLGSVSMLRVLAGVFRDWARGTIQWSSAMRSTSTEATALIAQIAAPLSRTRTKVNIA